MSEKNVLWEVVWVSGQREIVEARNLQQGGGSFLVAIDEMFGRTPREPLPEVWELFAEGRGIVWLAEKRLIQSIRCMDTAEAPSVGKD